MREVFLITGLLVLFYLGPQESIAQDNTNAIASITYQFIHINDTNNRENPHKEEMITYLGRYSSVYKSLDMIRSYEATYKMMRLKYPTETLVIGYGGEDLYLSPIRNYIAKVGKLSNTIYLIESEIEVIDWQIENETKEISGYSCQQAKGVYCGREYTVWFTTELPFSFGPWKLYGLPGLILQAQDSRNEVIFNFIAFEKAGELEVSVIPPDNAIRTTESEFEKANRAYKANSSSTRTGNGMIRYTVGNEMRMVTLAEYNEINEKSRLKMEARNNNPLELKVKHTSK